MLYDDKIMNEMQSALSWVNKNKNLLVLSPHLPAYFDKCNS